MQQQDAPLRRSPLALRLFTSHGAGMKSAEEDAYNYSPNAGLSALSNISLPLSMGTACLPAQYHSLQSGPIISASSVHHSGYGVHEDNGAASYYVSPGIRPNGAPALESPRIEITAYGQFPEDDMEESSVPVSKQVNSIVTLTLPSADGYRDHSCLSPASSLSSRSCHSEASSYESGISYTYDNSPQNSPWQSPCVSPKGSSSVHSCTHLGSPHASPSTSPRASVIDDGWMGSRGSRPASPCGGKRKYSFSEAPCRHQAYSPNRSPTPSPQTSPRISIADDAWLPSTNQYTNSAIVAAINALSTDGVVDLTEPVPVKSRRTSQEHGTGLALKVEPGEEDLNPGDAAQDDYSGPRGPFKKESYCGGFLDVPQHPYSWPKPKPFISSLPLPALDWQLPSCSGPYSLQIEVQPKSHHRAHYETEGSRGAVKASAGGHPVVQLHGYVESEPLTLQLFIGTADDRLLRPHAFYQVHRITGKTVSTASHELMQSNTKVLEIPLLPENNMRAVIDCAGILKLRNSDIELRKGETDIGRKNTRVRMVFRVHMNQPNGRTVSLQVASNPIECSQRSAQELPLVEKQSVDSYPVTGGKKMLLSGHNFLPDSKVVFVEKAQDGHHIWEAEAKVHKDSMKSTMLLLEIPPYRNLRVSTPVQVSYYVCNGKRKRSQYQRFTYLPANVPIIKTEPNDDYEPLSGQGEPALGMHSKAYFGPQAPTSVAQPDTRACLGGYSPCQPRQPAVPSPSPNSSPKLHDLSLAAYPKCLSTSLSQHPVLQPSAQAVPSIQETPGVSPSHSPLAVLQSPVGSHPYQRAGLYPNSSPCSSPTSHPSTPSGSHEAPFPLAYSPPPPPPVNSGSPAAAQLLKAPPRGSPPALLQETSRPPVLPVNVKQEPQELDQMYLDDVNEIIKNDLSSISVHSHA
ncbi:nuclear factor of activated T-cells, cytoplasmic 1 isoform X1 [Scleropages formosus]|uniref:nuclear factor of activated T-cells, cytoplasmic 1 isoform X1 n=1 Tax=Scleropages formosus TaxID=113540 RepID=UPI0010FA9BBD|nr:nuclear factor of activated T-cells, cytoplasmic 1-like isoform X1 [Scleropages formosus]